VTCTAAQRGIGLFIYLAIREFNYQIHDRTLISVVSSQRRQGNSVDNMGLIAQALRLVNAQGDPCDYGCSERELNNMIAYCQEMFPSKPYCAVKEWCWADLEIDNHQLEEARSEGVYPCFVYASYIIEDQAGRWSTGFSVRTTFLTEFHKNCLFVTRNTAYVLVGKGSRMTVAPAVYKNLTF